MRAVSPIVAITVLVLMTIAAAALAYGTIISFQDEASSATGEGVETFSAAVGSRLRIEEVAQGVIYIRNFGTVPLSGARFFLDGVPLSVSGPDPCAPGELCLFSLVEEGECEGECVLSMGEGMPIGTRLLVDEVDLQWGEGMQDAQPPRVLPAVPQYYQTICSQSWNCFGVYGKFGCGYTLTFNVTVDDSATGGSSIALCNYTTGVDKGGNQVWVEMSAYDGAFDSPTEIAVGSISIRSEVTVNVTCFDSSGYSNSTAQWVTGGGVVRTFTVEGCGSGTTCTQNPPNCPTGCGECV